MGKYNEMLSKMCKHLVQQKVQERVQQKVQQKVRNNYVVLLIKLFFCLPNYWNLSIISLNIQLKM